MITLLLIGAFLAVVGWVVGVVLLWRSRVWTLRDKLIGTLLWPGGLVTGAARRRRVRRARGARRA